MAFKKKECQLTTPSPKLKRVATRLSRAGLSGSSFVELGARVFAYSFKSHPGFKGCSLPVLLLSLYSAF